MIDAGIDRDFNFGYHRAEVLGALASVSLIWMLTVWLLVEAVKRLISPPSDFNPFIMMITAVLGILANLIMAFTLNQEGHKHFHIHIGESGCHHRHSYASHRCVSQASRTSYAQLRDIEVERCQQSDPRFTDGKADHPHNHPARLEKTSKERGDSKRDNIEGNSHSNLQSNLMSGKRHAEANAVYFDNAQRLSKPGRQMDLNEREGEILTLEEGHVHEQVTNPFLQPDNQRNNGTENKNMNIRAALIHIVGMPTSHQAI